jgi:peptidoglycan/xylan/chitin deacetylase (PgdA/CDA1 family)
LFFASAKDRPRARITEVQAQKTIVIGAIARVCCHHAMKKLSLTFDDGPSPPCTEALLAVLSYYSVPATFFMIGQRMRTHDATVRRVEQAGHAIGNHTRTHRNLCGAPFEAIDHEINRWGQYFRPPGGHYDEGMLDYLRLHDIQLAMWDAEGLDWKLKTADEIVAYLAEQIDRLDGDGGIVLMHDGDSEDPNGNRWATVEAADRIITRYRAQGFEFVPLSEMTLPRKPRKTWQ